jgi:predicted nucleotidyltransferase
VNPYAAARRKLLDRITRTLASDNRFPAAWLAGSFGRDEADRVSDLDITVVVANPHSQVLCARPWMAGASAPKERLALISRFGKPAIIHENHHNILLGLLSERPNSYSI